MIKQKTNMDIVNLNLDVRAIDYGENVRPRYAIKKDLSSSISADNNVISDFLFFDTRKEADDYIESVYNEYLDDYVKKLAEDECLNYPIYY